MPWADRKADIRDWCRGRWWPWRAALLAYLLWAGYRSLRDPDYTSLFGGVDFGVHELGHLVFGFFGEFLGVAGGSLAQLLLPLGAAALLWSRRDYFGVAVAGGWEALSAIELSRYVADARALELDLVSFGESAIHDWNYLLGRLGLLPRDLAIAQAMRVGAGLVLLGSLAAGAWICREMARPAEPATLS